MFSEQKNLDKIYVEFFLQNLSFIFLSFTQQVNRYENAREKRNILL